MQRQRELLSMAKWTCCDVVELLLLSSFFLDAARCPAFISIKTFEIASSWHATTYSSNVPVVRRLKLRRVSRLFFGFVIVCVGRAHP
jgi:hypothetical protein